MSIILSGCGGGCDLFGAIPYFYKLKNSIQKISNEKNLILVNLSFTDQLNLKLLAKKGQVKNLSPKLYKVDARKLQNNKENKKFLNYFPEYFISLYLQQPVYLILIFHSTISSITKDYNIIINEECKSFPLESLYLFDGGCDALLSGRESDLGTPVEDMMHIAALQSLKANKYVCAIGLTCDCTRLSTIELQERLNYLNKYLIEEEVWSLGDENVRKYYDIVTNSDFDQSQTIVHSLICARLEGKSGKYIPKVLKSRISENKIELDDMIITFVMYDYNNLIKDFEYLHKLKSSSNCLEIDETINMFLKKK